MVKTKKELPKKLKFKKVVKWRFDKISLVKVSFNIAFVLSILYLFNILPEVKWYFRVGYLIFIVLTAIIVSKLIPSERKVTYEEL